MHKHHMTALLVGGVAGLIIGYTQASPSTSLNLSQYPIYSNIFNYLIAL